MNFFSFVLVHQVECRLYRLGLGVELMRNFYNYFKIVFLLLFVIGNCPVLAVENFTVGFDQARVIPAKFKLASSPTLYVQKEGTYLSEGKSTKIKIDASKYFTANSKKITYPTQVRIKVSKTDPKTLQEIWLRTSSKTVISLKHSSSLFLDLDLGSFLSDYSEEFSFKLYDARGNFIEEYNQVFTAEDFNPDFAINLDQDFSSCARGENTIECIYEALGNIMFKPVSVRNTENYFARNSDGSLVMSVSTLDERNFKRRKKNGARKNKPSRGGKKGGGSKKSDEDLVDTKGITKFSTITSNASHYHGYTEHTGQYSMFGTSWDATHAYKNPAAYGNYSAVFGRNNKTSIGSIIAGEDNFTTSYSAVFGRGNTGNSSYSLIAGQDNYVDSSYALVSGKNNEVENAANSLVVGYYNNVNGEYASAVGYSNKIQGRGSHIWGSGITVNGEDSFAFGFGNTLNHTVINGDRKIAFVYGTETLLLVDGVNGSVQIGGSNGGSLSGFFNGTFVGDGSGLYNLNPSAFSGVVSPLKGGTGVANTGTFGWGGSSVNIINNHNLTMRLQAGTDITLPVTGTLSTLNGVETFTNKTLDNATFTSSLKVLSCSLGDFLLATENGVMQCTDFAAALGNGSSSITALGDNGSSSITALGDNGSIQYKLNGVLAGSNALKVSNNGNGLLATRIETALIHFPGTTSRATGQLSFSNLIDFDMTVNMDDSFTIPTCTTAGYILINDALGKFSCVDPSTVLTGSNGSTAAQGAQNAIQLNRNGSFSSDPDFRFENGSLVVKNIMGVENIFLSSADIMGTANFRGRTYIHNELRILDGNEGAGKVLVGDVNGTVSWVDASSIFTGSSGNGSNGVGLAAAGFNGSIQFNTGGALDADHTRLQYKDDTLKAQAITAVTMTARNVAGATVAIDWSQGNQQELRLSQSTTTISVVVNPAGPTTVMMQIVHDPSVGVKTINWPANFMFSDGAPPILSTQSNAIDFVSCFYNSNGAGTYFCQASYNFF